MGFDGWRFDFVKGYGGERVREYVEATRPLVAVGEFWDDCGYDGEHGNQLCANQVICLRQNPKPLWTQVKQGTSCLLPTGDIMQRPLRPLPAATLNCWLRTVYDLFPVRRTRTASAR